MSRRSFTLEPRLTSPRRAAVGSAVLVGVLTGAAVASGPRLLTAVFAALAAGTAIGIPIYCFLVHQREASHERRHLWALTGTMVNQRAWPVPGEWALGADALVFLEREIARRHLRTIVELGPGTSSIVLGRRFQGSVQMYGVEHDPAYARLVRDQLEQHGISGYTLIEAPIEGGWYRRSSVDELPSEIDVLLVDGPPNWSGEGNRRPAWTELGNRIRQGGLILVDDTCRADERQMALEWTKLDRVSLLYDGGSFIALEIG